MLLVTVKTLVSGEAAVSQSREIVEVAKRLSNKATRARWEIKGWVVCTLVKVESFREATQSRRELLVEAKKTLASQSWEIVVEVANMLPNKATRTWWEMVVLVKWRVSKGWAVYKTSMKVAVKFWEVTRKNVQAKVLVLGERASRVLRGLVGKVVCMTLVMFREATQSRMNVEAKTLISGELVWGLRWVLRGLVGKVVCMSSVMFRLVKRSRMNEETKVLPVAGERVSYVLRELVGKVVCMLAMFQLVKRIRMSEEGKKLTTQVVCMSIMIRLVKQSQESVEMNRLTLTS